MIDHYPSLHDIQRKYPEFYLNSILKYSQDLKKSDNNEERIRSYFQISKHNDELNPSHRKAER